MRFSVYNRNSKTFHSKAYPTTVTCRPILNLTAIIITYNQHGKIWLAYCYQVLASIKSPVRYAQLLDSKMQILKECVLNACLEKKKIFIWSSKIQSEVTSYRCINRRTTLSIIMLALHKNMQQTTNTLWWERETHDEEWIRDWNITPIFCYHLHLAKSLSWNANQPQSALVHNWGSRFHDKCSLIKSWSRSKEVNGSNKLVSNEHWNSAVKIRQTFNAAQDLAWAFWFLKKITKNHHWGIWKQDTGARGNQGRI